MENTENIPIWLINIKNSLCNELPEATKNSFIINFFDAAKGTKDFNKIETQFYRCVHPIWYANRLTEKSIIFQKLADKLVELMQKN